MQNMRSPTARATAGIVVAALVSAVACHRGAPRELIAGVTDSTFVWALGDLERIQRDANLDSAARATARDSILALHHVSAAQLEAAARALADQPQQASLLFQAVQRRALTP
jgi:hypothetical protein